MSHLLALVTWLAIVGPFGQDAGPEPEAARRGLILRDEGAFDGYRLFAPLRSNVVLLIGRDGDVVHAWQTDKAGHAVLLGTGNLLVRSYAPNPRFHGTGVDGGVLREIDWDGNVIWSLLVNDQQEQTHHDFDVLPNGNLMYLVREHRSREEAIANGRDPAAVGAEGMWPDAIVEIRPPRSGGAAEVVWEWHAWDHLVQDHDEGKANYGSIHGHPGRIDVNADHRRRPPMTEEELEALRELEGQMAAIGYGGGGEGEDDGEDDWYAEHPLGTAPDWLHTNAVTLHPELDLIVLSVPNLNELWVIDHSTTTEEAATDTGGRRGRGGEILWRWGSPRNYGAGQDSDTQLFFQHDPTWVPGEGPEELRLLVFNNGGSQRESSSVDELVLPFDPESGFRREPGRPWGPAQPAWSYQLPDDCTSSFISGARRLPNGNTLICAGPPGRLLEVTRDGRVVWDYENPFPGAVETEESDRPPYAIYRAIPIPRDHPGLAGRDL